VRRDRCVQGFIVATNRQNNGVSLFQTLRPSCVPVTTADYALLYFSMGVGWHGYFVRSPRVGGGHRRPRHQPVTDHGRPRTNRRRGSATRAPHPHRRRSPVSAAYRMLGDGSSHSFGLVRQDGEVAWIRHYPAVLVMAHSSSRARLNPSLRLRPVSSMRITTIWGSSIRTSVSLGLPSGSTETP
jgi:hypothetical protein